MSLNRNAFIRYKTIDTCLRDHSTQWTLNDLMEACGKALFELGDDDNPVSRRAIQMDLEHLRAPESGYHAPIVVVDKKYYTYSDPNYSIFKQPLTQFDCDQIDQIAELLEFYSGHAFFTAAAGLVAQLRGKAAGLELPSELDETPRTEPSANTLSLTPTGTASTVEFYAENDYAQWLIKNPIHPSQQLLDVRIDRLHRFSMEVVVDLNLERILLSHGEFIEILAPKPLRLKIGTRVWQAGRKY